MAAVRDVHFEIQRGQTLALVGESGSGKSTVARCVACFEKPESGQIFFQETDLTRLGSRELASFRPRIQMVFQDAITSMNPRFSALEVIEEPLQIAGQAAEGSGRACALMTEVGVSPDWRHRSIRHFSGGQRQRIALARALASRPEILILDEAISGLDLSTQAQIVNLLLDLQEAHSLTYLLISHDLALVAQFADVIGIMAAGQTVELGPTSEIVSHPQHAATRKLVASAKASATALAAITDASS